MTPEEKLRYILTTYPKDLYIIQTLEISHPDFSQTYFLTDETVEVVAFDENGIEKTYTPTNFEVTLSSIKNDLDQNFEITIADLDNVLDDELERIPLNNNENITFVYRAYNSDDFSGVGYGPFKLEVFDVSQGVGAFTVRVGAKQLNWQKTGKIYDYDVFPMLRAFQ